MPFNLGRRRRHSLFDHFAPGRRGRFLAEFAAAFVIFGLGMVTIFVGLPIVAAGLGALS